MMKKKLIALLILSIPVYLMGYKNESHQDKIDSPSDFRDYENVPESIKNFYLLNHSHQTLNFVLAKKKEYYPLTKTRMSIWQAIALLDTIVDESDPDTSSSQMVHAMQTAEQLRKDGHPRWLILTGFIHDLGKVLTHFGEPQWAVVGDTFPVGCAYSEAIVFHDYFIYNTDNNNRHLQKKYGMYQPHCGLDAVHMSWGHDEYLYQVVKRYLPDEASYIIRYHSFYAAHQKGAYDYLMDDYDRFMMKWIKLFSRYDLYSKSSEPINVSELLPYYQDLVAEFFPENIRW
jgi:inositol oxygenase